jgi:hypothetical protein
VGSVYFDPNRAVPKRQRTTLMNSQMAPVALFTLVESVIAVAVYNHRVE